MQAYEVRLDMETGDGFSEEDVQAGLLALLKGSPFSAVVTHVERVFVTMEEVYSLAKEFHEGQQDKIGEPYFQHVESVARGVLGFGSVAYMAALLHDTIEDTDETVESLLERNIDPEVVTLVDLLTNTPGQKYLDKIRSIAENYLGTLIKIADNAHNSLESRRVQLDQSTRDRLDRKYKPAREILWSAVKPEDVEHVLGRVNPGLLPQLYAMHPSLKGQKRGESW